MSEIVAALIGAIGVIAVAVVGLLGASKLGIGSNQEKLVSTLKDLISAQDQKIDELELRDREKDGKIAGLESRIEELEALTIRQAFTMNQQSLTIDQLKQGADNARDN